MTRRLGTIIAGSFLIAALTHSSHVAANEDGCWNETPGGKEVTAPDGSKRRTATATQAVRFPDQNSIRTAQIVAQERAKGDLARFIRQVQTSQRISVSENSEVAILSKSGNRESYSEDATSITKASMIERNESRASESLSGVVVIEQQYDPTRKAVCVMVGMSDKTIKAASDLSNALRVGEASRSSGSDTQETKFPDAKNPTVEVQKLKDEDW